MEFNIGIQFPIEIKTAPVMKQLGNTGLSCHAANEVSAIEISCDIVPQDTFAGTKVYRRFLCPNGETFLWIHGDGDARVKNYDKIKLSDVLSASETEAHFAAHEAALAETKAQNALVENHRHLHAIASGRVNASDAEWRKACAYFDKTNYLPTPNRWYRKHGE